MLVGTALQRLLFSNNFRYQPQWACFCPRSVWLTSLFSEEMNLGDRYKHPFSIQHLMEVGEKAGKPQGQWFTPSIIAYVYKEILSKYAEQQLGLSIHLCEAGLNTVYTVYLPLFLSLPLIYSPFLG